MTMGDKNLYGKLIVDVVIGPILEKLEQKDISAAQTLRSAISKAERRMPGLTYDLVRHLLLRAELSEKTDLCQTLLRLGGQTETEDIRIPRSESTFRELNTCAVDLKRILGRIPDQIYDRKQFLETIKEIASSIKTLLDAVNKVIAELPPHMSENGTKQVLEERKKEFVRYSKKFSNTLKEYFRDTSLCFGGLWTLWPMTFVFRRQIKPKRVHECQSPCPANKFDSEDCETRRLLKMLKALKLKKGHI